ncbi:testin-like [Sycon ciliatum]|uniref:testin-like n=1 Tax=Sycon ciliatum TaxID=27933 RepID=UPI0031F6DDCC
MHAGGSLPAAVQFDEGGQQKNAKTPLSPAAKKPSIWAGRGFNRVNPGTSLTTVNHRFGILQPVVVVQEQAKCTECRRCRDGYKPHPWRKVCRNCFCLTELHEGALVQGGNQSGHGNGLASTGRVEPDEDRVQAVRQALARARLGEAGISADTTLWQAEEDADVHTVDEAAAIKYTWTPRGLYTADTVERFMQELPKELRPVTTPQGIKQWHQLQVNQFPLHDVSVANSNDDQHAATGRQQFVAMREKEFAEGTVVLSKPNEICEHCSLDIADGSMAVHSEKLPGKAWHPSCFVCSTCDEFLVNLAHYTHAGKAHCGRHHAELTHPRCAGCDELIFDKQYTLAEGKSWHTDHFCCFYCDKRLGLHEDEYVAHDGHVVCLCCYDERLAKTCHSCDKKIGAGDSQLSYGDHHWHERCLRCENCSDPVNPEDFIVTQGKVHCQSCYGNLFLEQCAKCEQAITGASVSAMKGKRYHTWCFRCYDCNAELAGQKFYKRDDELYCKSCYDTRFAVACNHCPELVRRDGVRFRGAIYHRKCFEELMEN